MTRNVRVEFTHKEAEMCARALAMLAVEIEDNELDEPFGMGRRELAATERARLKLFDAGYE